MTFSGQLAKLTSREAAHGRGDDARLAAMIADLSSALGLTIALACRGDAKAIDTVVTGVEQNVLAEAVAMAPIARAMAARGVR